MSTAPAAPAGAAAAPDAGAAPAVKAKVETVPKNIRDRVLGVKPPATPPPAETDAEKQAKADKAAADKKAADDAAAAKAAGGGAAPKAGDTPPAERVKKVKEGPDLPPAPEPAAGKTVAELVKESLAAQAPAAPPVDPEIQREIDLATFAEQKSPERYTGMAKKITDFYTANDQLIAKKAQELGGMKSPEFKDWLESEEYKGWISQNRPAYARGERRKMEEDMIAERARAAARKEMEPEMAAMKRRQAELEHTPTINAKANHFLNVIITDDNAEKDPALTEFKADPLKFGEAHPEEAQLIAAEAQEGVELIKEIYRLENDLVDFDRNKPTPRQARLREFSTAANTELRTKHPKGIEMQDGKILVDAMTYERLQLHKDQRYRTFTADELAGMVATQKKAEVLTKLQRRREGVSKSIYLPKTAAPAAAPSGQETAGEERTRSPSASVSAMPGGKATTPPTAWELSRRKALTGK